MSGFGERLYGPGACLLGTWVKLPCAESVELLGLAGLDYVILDMEHTTLDLETVYRGIVVAEASGMAPLVRVPDHDYAMAARLLDAGAAGIVVPHICTAQEAKAMASAMLFAPRGSRGFGLSSRAGKWGLRPAAEYVRAGNDGVLRIPLIEDPEAVENIEAILVVDGVNAVFLGPGDLSASLGRRPDHPDVQALLDRALQASKRKGIPCGTLATPETAGSLAQRGYRFVTLSTDATMLGQAAAAMVERAQESLAATSGTLS